MSETASKREDPVERVAGHTAGTRDTGTHGGSEIEVDATGEAGEGGGITGSAGAGGTTVGAGAGGAASTDRTIVGITPDSLGVSPPEDTRPGTPGKTTSGSNRAGDPASHHPGAGKAGTR